MKKDKTTPEKFKHAAQMVIDYEKACNFCIEFIGCNAVPIKALPGKNANGVEIIQILLNRYELLEEYEWCALIFPFRDGFKFPSGVCEKSDLDEFINNSFIVLLYHNNCLLCWEEIEEFGIIALYPLVRKNLDDMYCLTLLDNLLLYFQDKRELKKCKYLEELREKIISKRVGRVLGR